VPAGRLRESPRALRRAHAVVVTRAERDDDWRAARTAVETAVPGLPVFRARHRPLGLRRAEPRERLPLEAVRGVPVAAFAGLARPEALSESLAELGARVVAFQGFPDHHAFTAADHERVVAEARAGGARFIVTTGKDAVRLDTDMLLPDLLVLDIEVVIEDEAVLLGRLEALCMPPSRTRAGAPPAG
jgi:tetraacyldisaccharide 4'-kinase